MIVGLTGTNGAGKGTVVAYLEGKSFAHYSARGLILEEVDRRGLPHNRTSTNVVGNDLRKQYGADYIAKQLLARAKEKGGNVIIESLRTVGEAEYLKSHGAVVWGVDADRKLRYERALVRGGITDSVTFEEFCVQEDREMNQQEKHDMNVQGVLSIADAVFTNNGTQEELFAQVEAALAGK